MEYNNIHTIRTPNAPKQTTEAQNSCKIIRLGKPAGKPGTQVTRLDDALRTIQCESESLLRLMEQHLEKMPNPE